MRTALSLCKVWLYLCECKIGNIKERTILDMYKANTPLVFWCFNLKFVCNCFNHTAKTKLNWRTPIEVMIGWTPDISIVRCECMTESLNNPDVTFWYCDYLNLTDKRRLQLDSIIVFCLKKNTFLNKDVLGNLAFWACIKFPLFVNSKYQLSSW